MKPDSIQFASGDHVHVANMGKGIVREVRNGGRYAVELKGRSVVVDGSQLTRAEGRHKRRPAVAADVPPTAPAEEPSRTHVPASLDLHGLTADEAVAALDTFLNDAILGGLAQVQVIHGRGSGRLRLAVHRRLKQLSAVRSYRLDPANAGATIVTL